MALLRPIFFCESRKMFYYTKTDPYSSGTNKVHYTIIIYVSAGKEKIDRLNNRAFCSVVLKYQN